jgi:hypothetical protein
LAKVLLEGARGRMENEEAGNRSQETEDNFKPLLLM